MRTVMRLLGFLAPYRRQVAGSLALAWGAMGMTVLIPWLVGRTVDAIERGTGDLVILLAVAVVAAGIARLGVSYWRRMVAGRVSLGVEYDLRNRLYGHLQRLELGFFDTQQTGQLMSRATADLQSVRFFLGYGLVFLSQHLLTIVLSAAVMVAMQPSLAVLALLPVPLIVAVATRYGLRNRPAVQEVQQRVAEVTAEAEETVSGIRIIKAFAREAHQQARFRRQVERVFEQSMVSTRLRALYNPLLAFLPNLGLAIVLLVGGHQVIGGTLTLGEFTAFFTYLTMLALPMRMLGVSLGMAQRAAASGNRIFELLDRQPTLSSPPGAPPPPPGRGRVQLRGVTLRYGEATPALHDVSLDVEAGSTLALVGPTGSGKTSLVALVPRLYDPVAGAVLLDGADVRELDLEALRREVALVSDESFLFSATVAENIAYAAPDATRAQVQRAAERAQAAEFIAALPAGYETRVGERGYTLSGGQRQRIAIARALLADPRVLILDDATSSVDARTEELIKQGLREVMRDRTTLVIAHRLSTVSLADEVAVLDGGRLVDRGPHEQLLERCALYAEIAEKGLADSVFLQRDLEQREAIGL